MNSEKLKACLNHLWAGVIINISFDLLNHCIILLIKIIENGKEEIFEITFKDVSAHYFVKDYETKRFNILTTDKGDYLELTSINYFADGIGSILIESPMSKWLSKYSSSANFVLEIWNEMLLIEAKSVIINNEEFKCRVENNNIQL